MLGDITNVVGILGDITNVVTSSGAKKRERRAVPDIPVQGPRPMSDLDRDIQVYCDDVQQPKRTRRSSMDEASNAVRDSLYSTGMDSQWTSTLAQRLRYLPEDGDLSTVLRIHGWDGSQFLGPPDREQLLADLCKPVAFWRNRHRRGGA